MQQSITNKNMQSTKPNSFNFDQIIGSIIKMALAPPKNQNKDESDFYRWKSSFNFKKNINTMYYTNLSDSYELQDYLREGYNQVKRMIQYFQNTDTENIQINQKSILEEQKHYGLMKKYKNLLTHQYCQKQETPKYNQDLYSLPFQQAKKRILKEYPDQFNRNQITKYFQDLIVNHKLFSFKPEEQEFVFEEIVKKISPRMNYNVYLPSMVKVIMANVNWIDRENDTASLALKIEVKVNVPGISQYPYFYEQVFKEKMKISLKTSNRSNVFNEKIRFNNNHNQRQTFQIVDDKIFKKKTKSKYHHDPIHFLNTSYKWLNYDKPTYIYQKRVQQFQGFILQASVSDVRVLINAKTFVSPFEMLDLHGIVQLDSIITEMKDWIQILYEKDNSSSLKQFLIEASPKVTIKFNIISLYQNLYNVQIDEKITLNHIRSFDAVDSEGYNLAQNLMFLQVTNQRQSRYALKKFSKCRLSYKWYRNEEKIFEERKLKNQYIREIEVQQEESNLKSLYEQLKVRTDHRYFHNKYSRQFNIYKNIQQMNKKLSEKFLQIRTWIYQHSEPKKPQPLFILQQNNEQHDKYELYHQPENLKYDKVRPYLPVLKCIQQAYIHNQLYIKAQLNEIYHHDFSEKLSRQIYKFVKYKYKFQKYYKRVLQILIVQLEDEKGIYFDSEQQSLIGDQNLSMLKQRLKEVIYNHNTNKLGQNLENVKIDQQYHYSKAIYHFPFYRNPLPTLLLLFSSTVILCVINLFIFFQQQELNGRLASTAALMICFIGLVSIMQKQIHSDTISVFEILIYAMMLTPVFCLAFSLESYLYKKQITEAYVRESLLFWISVLISLFGFLIPAVFAAFFTFCQSSRYQKNYNVEKQMQPLFLLFPGSPEVDRLIAKQQNFLEYCEDEFTKNEEKKYKKNKTLQRVVTSLMVKHLNSLYELRKTDNYIIGVQNYIKYNLKKSIKNNQKFIQNTFQIPKNQKGKENEESLQSTTNISLQNISPVKSKKNKNEENFEELREIFKSKKNLKCVVFSWDD